MSLFKSIGNFVKDIIPGKIDDAIIDTVFKEGTGEKIKESFFPSSKSSSQSQVGESFFNLRDRISESGARRGTTLSRYTGETPARYTRFLTPSVVARLKLETVDPVKQTPVKVAKRTKQQTIKVG
tara:strand:+ start:99 stop:473 length:375 start_codon:yes stop_codon:yes gene_type:complete